VMNRLPLPIVLPLGAALMVGIIGISFGLTFLELDSRWGHNAPLFVATGITALIMLVAGLLHQRATKQEAGLVDPGVPLMGGKADRPGDPTDKGPTDPTRPTP
jgi:hypothetical protein